MGSENIKIQALDLGADDYLVMPFSMEEFLAHVRSALRRWSVSKAGAVDQGHLILCGDLLIDTDSRHGYGAWGSVHLTRTEYGILVYLARRAGKVVTHRELLKVHLGRRIRR